ncbi:hypothetical protein CMEL01_14015 [Colletotrichum melonis]|uniref:Uncharacterized protein n=1 Tax=Colletotrichum melonis TaxID=1209925 RepID=A0AAI9URJ8_9PEZI|nr:hypothetical protein CMEL01_14015 [Colletotrichum melonis]
MFNGADSATTAQLTVDDGMDDEMQTRLSLITKIREELDFKRRTGFSGIYRAGFWSLLMVLDIVLSQWVPDDGSGTMTPEEHSQSEIERTKARGRDGGLCIATGVADPEICYIVAPIVCPPESLFLLASYVHSAEVVGWDEDFYARIKAKLSAGRKGITTLKTNTLCLSRQLEPSWS